jgi:hypothetical protein
MLIFMLEYCVCMFGYLCCIAMFVSIFGYLCCIAMFNVVYFVTIYNGYVSFVICYQVLVLV